tara:strand:+ start:633 stop:989 length:357 start_codon:yes stop_codon:yes gene_type:complete
VQKLYKLLTILLFFSFSVFADNLSVANTITYKDLDKSCAEKYLEWYSMSSNQSEWGMAQIKVFFLVDKNFLTIAATSEISGSAFGKKFGKNFKYFCEKTPTVSVRTAAKQTINSLSKE